jgi:hypothetical protein
MSAVSLRRVPRKRVRRQPVRPSVEFLREAHAGLVGERQTLRAAGADFGALERNRLEIVHCQRALAVALIERYLPSRPARSAA